LNAHKLTVVSFLAAAVFAIGCAADDGGLQELEENRLLWESHGIADYSMEVIGIEDAPTVTVLFEEIERGIERGDFVQVEYNQTLGFPERAVIVTPGGDKFDFEVVFLETDFFETPGGDVVVEPPVRIPDPRLPGFDEIAQTDPIKDVPPAGQLKEIVVDQTLPGTFVAAQD